MKFERVLATIDFSPSSRAVVRWAQRAAREDGSIRLLHVVDTTVLADAIRPAKVLDAQMQLEQEALKALESLARAEGGDERIELEVAFGEPAETIISLAAKVDLVVVGVRAKGLAERWALGSVAEEVALGSPVPTMVAREPEGEGRPERVLVLVDLSAPSIEALRVARDLERRFGVRVAPLHVVESKESIPEATRVLEAFVRGAIDADVPVEVVAGSAPTEILARATPRDLLVCGTHGRRQAGVLVLGSVAAKTIRHAPCPVVVVRPGDASAA
ncbi:MAG TPA: universal stress protein [Planctomycetota bacterium]|nr:universal stress protein [Planctomycetota bacterium]